MTYLINGLFPGVLSSDTTVGGCIDIFENVWPDPKETICNIENECKNIDSGVYWQRAETTDKGAYQNIRTNKTLLLTHLGSVINNQICQNVHNQLNILLMAALAPYTQKYNISESLWHEEYSMLKYNQGEQYFPHYDGNTHSGRCISAILYLNDDYEGGEIEFVNFGIKIKPESGMLILFPSNYAYKHVAYPVKTGTKYALVTWIRDRNNFQNA